MNFKSHQNQLFVEIENTLTRNKQNIINDFINILSKAKTLYKTDSFDFWLNTITETDPSKIPITKYGHAEAARLSKFLKVDNRHQFRGTLLGICERLFTYSTEDELCSLQSNFHFYYSPQESVIFKISELGSLEGIENVEKGSYRIAYTRELNLKDSELYT